MDMSDPATIAAIAAVATTGAGAITKLWGTVVVYHNDVKSALAHCEEEHEKARNKIEILGDAMATLKSEVGHLKGRIEGFQESENRRQTSADHHQSSEDRRQAAEDRRVDRDRT